MIRIKKKPAIKKVKQKVEVGCCYDCIHSYLMQSRPHNPIVSECSISKEREVAKVHMCKLEKFEKNEGEKVIHNLIKAL